MDFGNSKSYKIDDESKKEREIANIRAFQTALYGKANFKSLDTMLRKEMIEYCFSSDLEVVRATRTFKTTLEWAIQKGIMPKRLLCKKCSAPMRIEKSHRSSVDGFVFQCTTRNCRTYSHIRSVSMYSVSHITIMEITKVIFHYFVRAYNAR